MTDLSPIIGHQKRWAALARAFAKQNVPQTLLISGPPQTGKETLAQRFAQLLLCPNVTADEENLPQPCGKCRVCHQVEIETFPDYKVFRPVVSGTGQESTTIAPDILESSVFLISMSRDFGHEAMIRPLVGKRKVMMIVQCDRMTDHAENALLKNFEEPINGLSIILLTDNINAIRATIRSRCWHLPLGLAPDGEIENWLIDQFPDVDADVVQQALQVAQGRAGAAWREVRRLLAQNDEEETPLPRFAEVEKLVSRIVRSQPVGALGLTEESLRLARSWWNEDQQVMKQASTAKSAKSDGKKLDAKELRSATARFLDELATVYRARWEQSLKANGQTSKRGGILAPPEVWASGLDQVRRTRHYILRNANTNLALDVLFGRLIAEQHGTTLRGK